MKKLSGGFVLQCGHRQVVSEHRFTIAKSGQDQHAVWCVECEGWTTLAPFVSVPENEIEQGD
jgi:hypothetical protein